MVGRLLLGIIKGLLIGGAVAAGLIKGLGVEVFGPTTVGAVLAYASAVVVGVLAGLLAGKPFWRKEAKIEAGLKAGAGAFVAAAAMYAARKWLTMDLDLTMIEAGRGAIGQMPAASLPVIAAGLAMLYDLDNTPEAKEEGRATSKRGRVAADKLRIGADDEVPLDDLEAREPARKRQH